MSVRRIVIVKWDSLYANSILRRCSELFGGAEIEVSRSASGAARSLSERNADLVISGLSLPDTDGLDMLSTFAECSRWLIVISGRRDEQSMLTLSSARFHALFDPLEEDSEKLTDVIAMVTGGAAYISPHFKQRLLATKLSGPLSQCLSEAELQVLAVIGDGSQDDEAGERLGLSRFTVQTHRREIMRKLGVHTSAKLVYEAMRLGVVRLTPHGSKMRPDFDRRQATWRSRKRQDR